MEPNSKILVLGATGLVGSALVAELKHQYKDARIVSTDSRQCDLTDSEETDCLFEKLKPDYVFNCAAYVGGIESNLNAPSMYLDRNLVIQQNVYDHCIVYGVKKLLFLGSSCMYPANISQPMHPDQLGSGKLEPTNESYALAKLVGFQQAKNYFWGSDLITICPIVTNVYGNNDHFNEQSHVIPALVKKICAAHIAKYPRVVLRGTGLVLREFIHANDLARALVLCMESLNSPDPINIGSGFEIMITDLAKMIAELVGYRGELVWESTALDGQKRKLLDSTQIRALGFSPEIPFTIGLHRVILDYLDSCGVV